MILNADRQEQRDIADFWLWPEGSGGGDLGLKVAWLSDDLAPVGKLHTSNDLWQLVVAVKATPGLLRPFDQLEHHGERGPVREASLRADRPVSDGREGAFDRI